MSPLALALLAAAASPPLPSTPPQPPSFAASVEAVYVDVFVTDRNGQLAGLTASDFALRDNGVPRAVELVSAESQPLTTFLVLDTSGSVAGEKLAELRNACRALLASLHGEPVGLLTFSEEIRLRSPPSPDPSLVERHLAGLSFLSVGGSTALYDALYTATLLSRRHGRTLLALFTDGEDNLSFLSRAELRRVLEGSNVILQAVGVVPEASAAPDALQSDRYLDAGAAISFTRRAQQEPEYVRRLGQLAEATGGRFWAASAPDRLTAAFAAMLAAMRTRYVLRFEAGEGARPGLHRLEVRLTRRSGSVRYRRSYFVPPRVVTP